MHQDRFDAWTRRRFGLTAGSTLVALLGTSGRANLTAGKTKSKLKRNKYGCVNVGKSCRGKDANCCSGVCRGSRPKLGEKDRSHCASHDATSCQKGDDSCATGGIACTTTANMAGFCQQTTGKASFCAADGEGLCSPCKTDADCRRFCGPLAACVVCEQGDCPDTGDRLCMGPGACCREPGAQCIEDADCCSRTCRRADDGESNICRADNCGGEGAPCQHESDCCELACISTNGGPSLCTL
jgi:hypothetical protein